MTSPHNFEILSIDYTYVLTELDDSTVRVDGFGSHVARASTDLTSFECGKGYPDCLNFLLIEPRHLAIFSADARLPDVSMRIDPGDDCEPHKHPNDILGVINSGEIIRWSYFTSYHMLRPTAEEIEGVRAARWWDSANRPLLCFYHHLHRGRQSRLALYVPDWLDGYEDSGIYASSDFDSPELDEATLGATGIRIDRVRQFGADPRNKLDAVLYDMMQPALASWHASYFSTTCAVNLDANQELPFDCLATVGFCAPNNAAWGLPKRR